MNQNIFNMSLWRIIKCQIHILVRTEFTFLYTRKDAEVENLSFFSFVPSQKVMSDDISENTHHGKINITAKSKSKNSVFQA